MKIGDAVRRELTEQAEVLAQREQELQDKRLDVDVEKMFFRGWVVTHLEAEADLTVDTDMVQVEQWATGHLEWRLEFPLNRILDPAPDDARDVLVCVRCGYPYRRLENGGYEQTVWGNGKPFFEGYMAVSTGRTFATVLEALTDEVAHRRAQIIGNTVQQLGW